jgi:hypothetical protein
VIKTDDPVEMPKMVMVIRLGFLGLFVAGMAIVILVENDDRRWLYGIGIGLAMLFGVLSILQHAVRLLHDARFEEIQRREVPTTSTGTRMNPAQSDGGDSFGGGGFGAD